MPDRSATHRINLNAAWYDRHASVRKRFELDQIDWSQQDLPVCLVRKFNQPTNLDNDLVYLELVDVPVGTLVCLNEQQLGRSAGTICEFEIGNLLQPGQNVLELSVGDLTNDRQAHASSVRIKLV